MNEREPLLTVRFDGEAIGPGTITVPHLLRFLSHFVRALQRTGRVLLGDSDSVQRGQPPRNIAAEVELSLVSLTHGSRAAILGFERRHEIQSFPGMDFGLEILEAAIAGLRVVQDVPEDDAETAWPRGYDTGVLMAWRQMGTLFGQGIDKIDFSLNHRNDPVRTRLTPQGAERIRERIGEAIVSTRTIEGRLLMADFKEDGAKCRIHPSAGDPVSCLFDEERRDEVLENILRYVRIVGDAEVDPRSERISGIKIRDIERVEDRDGGVASLLPRGTPMSQAFWHSPSLEELARAQNVRPMEDIQALFGTWPDEESDGFESAIEELRHPGGEQRCRP